VIKSRKLDSNSLVVEAAGYMLKNFLESGILVLGIDPAQGPAQAAQQQAFPRFVLFFNQDLARQLQSRRGTSC